MKRLALAAILFTCCSSAAWAAEGAVCWAQPNGLATGTAGVISCPGGKIVYSTTMDFVYSRGWRLVSTAWDGQNH